MPVFTQDVEVEIQVDLDDIYYALDTDQIASLIDTAWSDEHLRSVLNECENGVIEEITEYISEASNSTLLTLSAIVDGPTLSTEIANLGPISKRRLLDALAPLGVEGMHHAPVTPSENACAETPIAVDPPVITGLSIEARQGLLRNLLHTLNIEQVSAAISNELAAHLLNAIAYDRGAIGLSDLFARGVGHTETESYRSATNAILSQRPESPEPEEEEDNLSILLDQLLAAPPENLAGLPDEQFVQLVRKLNPEVKSLLNTIPHPTDPAASTALNQLKHLFG